MCKVPVLLTDTFMQLVLS